MDPLIQVTLVANAGILLRVQDTSILLDALFSDPTCSFCEPSPATKERLLCGRPPFDAVDYVLFTHLHKDHFSEDMNGSDVVFSYRIEKGPADSRNAIKLLRALGYDPSIADRAEKRAGQFTKTGIWEL